MEKRIELEKRGRKPEEVMQLILDDCRSTTVVGLTDEYINLRSLSLISVGLTSLKGFPILKRLTYLDLSENRISNSLQNLTGCIGLKSLNLSQNKIKDFEAIEPLQTLPRLKILDLSNNEVVKEDGYKEFVKEKFANSLKYLDGDSLKNGKNDSFNSSDSGEEDDSESEAEEEEGEDDDESEYDSEDADQTNESGGVGLEEMLKDNIDEESEGNDYVLDEEEVDSASDNTDESDEDREADDSTANDSQDTRGKKRKLDDE
ncbi:acidic leucine-rich nuclear phosphoprotein 32 family member A-like [Daktulosphaira vitifoliae]|uniref:acidic leucine-rich nuclear phosphoprotein 32 family member A-like n=1 Tax=Daktulosphaira vitifoliae TaxID=58002 RepID=UPI0021AA5779|nr:acidic leucine-rich nuclear phosphoprotein 32 family member A-like [Daktulosphaira vitifoliae]